METVIKRTRKKKPLAEDAQLAKIIAQGPPENGQSCLTRIWPELPVYLPLVKEDWTYRRDVGWVHKLEAEHFERHYRLCHVTGRWAFAMDMKRTIYSGVKQYVHSAVMGAPHNWKLCQSSNRLAAPIDLEIVRLSNNEMAYVSRSRAMDTSLYQRCQLSNSLWCVQDVVTVKHPHTPGMTCYSHYHAKRSDKFKECGICGRYMERAGFKATDDGPMCSDCYTTRVLTKLIHKHDYTGYPSIKRSGSTRYLMQDGKMTKVVDESIRLFGVECEVEIHDDCPFNRYELARNVQDVLGKDFVVMKNDGSLKNHPRDHPLWGFEIVTAPADLAEHQRRWAELEKAEGFKYLRAWDTTTCGLHIHIGKSHMTTLQIGRIMMFITGKKNRKFIEKVAGRNSEAASRFVDKGLDGGMKPDPDKYCAVNIRPANTIEFRIFRGTIRYQHIVRNLEFTDAVCSFCHPASRAFSELHSPKYFLKFCEANRKSYPFFTKWLGEQGFIEPAKVKPGTKPEESVEKEVVTWETAPKWY